MQPTNPHPGELAKDVQPFPVAVNPTNPRQRNRLHNQAIRRAKANIGKRREHVLTPPGNHDDDARHSLVPVIKTTEAGLDAQLTSTAIAISPRSTVTSGGLRGDPFCAFPISADTNVLSAVDYFLQHYAPVHINPRKDHLGPADSLPLSRKYFGLALENASMFELMVALSRASFDARQGNARGPTREVLVHYGKGIEALRLRMAKSSACDDDATILSVMALLGIALIYGDFRSFETHLTGLRHLVDMRGGVDSLGWGGFIKNSITGLESLWAYHENKKLSIATTETHIKLEYPKHPFPPELCVTIAKLPDGFRELALSATLSLQIIALLSNVSEWVSQMQFGRKKNVLPLGEPNGTYLRQTHMCLELVPLRGLDVLERAICAAIATVTTETFNKTKQQNPVHRRMIETLSEMLFRYDLQSLPAECTMWLALVIAGPPRPVDGSVASPASSAGESCNSDESQRPRDVLLDKTIEGSPSARNWKWVKKAVQKFFFNEELLEAWQQTWEVAVLRYAEVAKQRRQLAIA
ncbi:hypothetical protein G647_00659 [Cladophialophora carrionii CBS 160.54]|uniref:Transcription factor domain-containing protein n=1 Tax=Cladophialophora carrionii CBS 160.54 TaxID=1279043 RepID=V9DMW0_9EURO|nr:uncharacterized protein G647_00659 [Cladophialophora carrionii CBS 160.54]ETI28210.1 hypothetical protein G647_00659 [Cladophialophora carrionii CBS 160.54]